MCWNLPVSVATAVVEVCILGVLLYRARVLGRTWEYAPCIALGTVTVVEICEALVWMTGPAVHRAGTACPPSFSWDEVNEEFRGEFTCCEPKYMWEGSLNSFATGVIRVSTTLQPLLMVVSTWLVQPSWAQARYARAGAPRATAPSVTRTSRTVD